MYGVESQTIKSVCEILRIYLSVVFVCESAGEINTHTMSTKRSRSLPTMTFNDFIDTVLGIEPQTVNSYHFLCIDSAYGCSPNQLSK